MRVAVISGFETWGGADLATARLCQGLARTTEVVVQRFVGRIDLSGSRCRKFVQTGKARQVLEDVAGWVGRADHPWLDGLRATKNRLNLLRMVRAYNPDVINIHSVNPHSGTHLRRDIAADLCGVAPVVWTLHDMWPLTGCCDYVIDCEAQPECGWHVTRKVAEGITPQPTSAVRAAEARRLLDCDGRLVFAAPSSWMAARAREVFSGRLRAEVIPNGLDVGWYHPVERAIARTALNLPDSGKIVMAVAAILGAKRKGLSFLVKALPALREPAVLLLVGRVGAQDRARFPADTVELGEVADQRLLQLAYAAADVVVVPSLMDNLPNVLLESLASGTPCVGFATGGIPEVVRPGETGELAQPENKDSLAAAIDRILSLDAEASSSLSSRCRDVARQEYDLPIQAARYRELFQSLAVA